MNSAAKAWRPSETFAEYARRLLELHRFSLRGENDSDEADAVRDLMDEPYYRLTDEERELSGRLSADLYSIEDDRADRRVDEASPQSERGLPEANAARLNGDWVKALDLRAQWKEHVSPIELSSLHAELWNEAGFPEVAAEFSRHASELAWERIDARAAG